MNDSISQIAKRLVSLAQEEKATAWDEGLQAGRGYEERMIYWKMTGGGPGPGPQKPDNPYRRGS